MRRFRVPVAPACAILLATAAASAGNVDVTLDAAAITEVLSTMTPDRFEVPLLGGRPVEVRISDFKVTGFDPSSGENGFILTSLRLRAPELNLDMPVTPRLSLEVHDDTAGEAFCVLRFRDVELDLPVIGSVDVSSALRPIRFLAQHVTRARGGRGDLLVSARLTEVLMGTRALRLRLDLRVQPVEAPPTGDTSEPS